MNKAELIASISEQAHIPKTITTKAFDALIKTITAELKAGHDVTLVGFGTFSVKERAARTGRHPRTGEELAIAAAKLPGFKPGKALKDALS